MNLVLTVAYTTFPYIDSPPIDDSESARSKQ